MGGLVNTLTLNDPAFPEALKHINSPPKQLYWIGEAPSSWLQRPKIAIVGSRKFSPYGKWATQEFAGELAKRGVVILSGLALGVDSIAHRACLDAGGTTAAILPTSLDNIYPASHLNLSREIISSGGSLISEYKTGAQIFKTNFIARNRIVSGLADLLLITEAAAKSGTIHTARFALDQGKTVMAVPGNINNTSSEGCNNLIKSGALAATDVSDVLFALGINETDAKKKLKPYRGTPQEELILKLIAGGASDQEELAVRAGLDTAQVSSALTMLEIAGYIRPEGSGRWTAF